MEQLGVVDRGAGHINPKRNALSQERPPQTEQRLRARATPAQREVESLRRENLQLRVSNLLTCIAY